MLSQGQTTLVLAALLASVSLGQLGKSFGRATNGKANRAVLHRSSGPELSSRATAAMGIDQETSTGSLPWQTPATNGGLWQVQAAENAEASVPTQGLSAPAESMFARLWDRSGLDSLFTIATNNLFWRTQANMEQDAPFWETVREFAIDAATSGITTTGNLLYDLLWDDGIVHGMNLIGGRGIKGAHEFEWGVPAGTGELFKDGVARSDIRQGWLGDCIHLAGIAAIAAVNPDVIRDAIRDNGDGTYTVTLHEQRPGGFVWEPKWRTVEITVTAEVPLLPNGIPPYAKSNYTTVDGELVWPLTVEELWPTILEKALAIHRGGYHRLNGGLSSKYVMEALTGETSNVTGYIVDNIAGSFGLELTLPTIPHMQNLLDEGFAITIGANPTPLTSEAIPTGNHVYYVRSVNVEEGTVDVGNPWGPNYDLTFTQKELERNFSSATWVRATDTSAHEPQQGRTHAD